MIKAPPYKGLSSFPILFAALHCPSEVEVYNPFKIDLIPSVEEFMVANVVYDIFGLECVQMYASNWLGALFYKLFQ